MVRIRQVPRLTSCGSQAGDQCPKKRVIFLLWLPQLKIGFGWGDFAPKWITAPLTKPHALSNLRFIHSGTSSRTKTSVFFYSFYKKPLTPPPGLFL